MAIYEEKKNQKQKYTHSNCFWRTLGVGTHTFFMAKVQLIFMTNYSFKCTQLLIKRLKWENRTNEERINQMLKSAFLAYYCQFRMKSHINCAVPLSLIE